jgi:hydroxymethylglutaryl-CoA lyase
MSEFVTITETARDAWQGLSHTIPTADKLRFLQRLLDAGFQSLDIGSFVSRKRVPSMADTAELPGVLKVPAGATLTALVATPHGLERLLEVSGIGEVLYPFSLSERFQQRNTNRSREQAASELAEMTVRSHEAGRTMYATISMAFGNNEGEPYELSELTDWVARLDEMGVDRVGLADTTAQGTPELVHQVFQVVGEGRAAPAAHLHVTQENQAAMVDAALDAGCRSFDAALGGLGGCQFAKGAESNVSTHPLVRQLIDRGFAVALPVTAIEALDELDAAAKTLAG